MPFPLRVHRALIAILALVVVAPISGAQTEEEPLLDRLRRELKKDYFRVGALLQIVFDAQSVRRSAGENGFSVANARVSIAGDLDGGVSYLLQTNFVNSPALLDGRLSYRAMDGLTFDVGQFKAPFSQELLTAASDIDFVNRSQVVTVLAPGRQIGLQARGRTESERWGYGVGLFNGNGIGSNLNDESGMMVSARLDRRLGDIDEPLELGLNAAASDDKAANLGTTIGGEPLIRDFEGTRVLVGADARWTPSRFLLAAEFIYGDVDPSLDPALDIYGYHLTAAAKLGPSSQALVRFDQLETDTLERDSDLLLFGYNLWPTSATEVQANVVVPTIDFEWDYVQFLINFQISF